MCSVENFATFSKPTEATKILSPDFMYRDIIWGEQTIINITNMQCMQPICSVLSADVSFKAHC